MSGAEELTHSYDLCESNGRAEVQTDLSIAPSFVALPIEADALGSLCACTISRGEIFNLADDEFRAPGQCAQSVSMEPSEADHAFLRHERSDAALCNSEGRGGCLRFWHGDGEQRNLAAPRQEEGGHDDGCDEARRACRLAFRCRGHSDSGDGAGGAACTARSPSQVGVQAAAFFDSQTARSFLGEFVQDALAFNLAASVATAGFASGAPHLVVTVAALDFAPAAYVSPTASWAERAAGQHGQGGRLQLWRAPRAPLELPGRRFGGRLGAAGLPSSTTSSQRVISPQGAFFYEVDDDGQDCVRLQHLQSQDVDHDELRLVGLHHPACISFSVVTQARRACARRPDGAGHGGGSPATIFPTN